MKKRIVAVLAVLAALCFALTLTVGCKDKNGKPDPIYSLTIEEENISLNLYDEGHLLLVTAQKDLEAVEPTGIVWNSGNDGIAAVTDGFVVPRGAGSTTVTASWQGQTATCGVTVSDAHLPSLRVEEASLGFIYKTSDPYKVNATVFYVDDEYDTSAAVISYAIAEGGETVATVSVDGTVTPVGIGNTVLKISASFNGYDGAGMSAEIPVSVKSDMEVHAFVKDDCDEVIYLKSFTFGETEYKNNTAFDFTVAYVTEGSDAPVPDPTATVIWHVSDEEVASITEDGALTAIKAGEIKVWCAFEKDGDLYTSEEIEITVDKYLLVDKTAELTFDFNRKTAKTLPSATAVFGEGFTGEIIGFYGNGDETNLLNEGNVDFTSFETGNYNFVIESDAGYAFKVASAVYEFGEDYAIMPASKNGVYYWTSGGEASGTVETGATVGDREVLISSSIDIGELAVNSSINYYWTLSASKREIGWLLNDGYTYLKFDYYADWNAETPRDIELQGMSITKFRWSLAKAEWSSFYYDLQYIYDNYEKISNATQSEYLFKTISVKDVSEYSLAISSVTPIMQAEEIHIAKPSDMGVVNTLAAKKYVLDNDITINIKSGYASGSPSGTPITSLYGTFDLNGHTITAVQNNENQWLNVDVMFAKKIEATGVLENGAVAYTYQTQGQAMAPGYDKGVLIDENDGLVKNVEFKVTVTQAMTGVKEALFGNGSEGTFENVVVRASLGVDNANFGVFENDVPSTLTLKNCVFVRKLIREYCGGEATDTNFSNLNSTNVVSVKSLTAYKKANYQTAAFTAPLWTVESVVGLPQIIAEDLTEALESEATVTPITFLNKLQCSNISGKEGIFRLQNDVTLEFKEARYNDDGVSGTGSDVKQGHINFYPYTQNFIANLMGKLDLNGYTLTIDFVATEVGRGYWFAMTSVIGTVADTGSIENGKIVFNYDMKGYANNTNDAISKGVLVNVNNGLIKNVEIEVNATPMTSKNMSVFGSAGTGTFENVVLKVSGSGNVAKFGVFHDANAAAMSATLKNCVIISSVNFVAGTDNSDSTTLAAATLDNTVYHKTVAEFTAAEYDASGFDTTLWQINEDTKLPEYKVKV